MIIKSFVIIAIALDLAGLHGMAAKFDSAVVRDRQGAQKVALASNNKIELPPILPRPRIKNSISPQINAQSYILVDANSGTIILKNNSKDRVPIASTTKIMTALVVLENYKLEDIVTISPAATAQIGADANLIVGEKISIKELLHCMLIKSGNDSAYALAEFYNNQGEVGTKRFVQKMNEKARELGLKDTEYHDSAGLDVTGYSSANDLAIVTKEALKNETFLNIVGKAQYTATSVDGKIRHSLDNSNRLVNQYQYPGAIGVKTGYMPEAGHCLVGAATRNGHTFIAIVLKTFADTPSASADETRKLLDWGFANVEWK